MWGSFVDTKVGGEGTKSGVSMLFLSFGSFGLQFSFFERSVCSFLKTEIIIGLLFEKKEIIVDSKWNEMEKPDCLATLEETNQCQLQPGTIQGCCLKATVRIFLKATLSISNYKSF